MNMRSITKLFRSSRTKKSKGQTSIATPDQSGANLSTGDAQHLSTRNTAPTRPRINVDNDFIQQSLDDVDYARETFNEKENLTHAERKNLIAVRQSNEVIIKELTENTKTVTPEYKEYLSKRQLIESKEADSVDARTRKHEHVASSLDTRGRREKQEDGLVSTIRKKEAAESINDSADVQSLEQIEDQLVQAITRLCEEEIEAWYRAAEYADQERKLLFAAHHLAEESNVLLSNLRDSQHEKAASTAHDSHDMAAAQGTSTGGGGVGHGDRDEELDKALHALEASRATRSAELDRALKALEASRNKKLPADDGTNTGADINDSAVAGAGAAQFDYDLPADANDWQHREMPLDEYQPTDASELLRLREENRILREQAARALKELKAYQTQYPSPYSSSSNGDEDGDDISSGQVWATSTDVVAPLFAAYDARIAELQDTVSVLHAQIDHFKENATVLVKENEELRTAQLDKLQTASAGAAGGLDPSAPINAEIIGELSEQVDVLRGENNLLSEQRLVLMTELDNHQAELEKKTNDLSEQAQQLAAAMQSAQAYQNRLQQTEVERDEAARQAIARNDSLGKAEIEIESATEQIAVLKQKCRDADALVADLRRQLKSTSENADVASTTTLQRVIKAEDRVKELRNLLLTKNRELDTAHELNRKLRNEYQTTRQDAEGMLQVMSGLERQLSEYAARESEVEKQAKLSKDREEEALTVKEQCAAREQQYKREIDRLINERKMIALRRKDELENALEQSRRTMGEHAASFEKEMDDLSERNAKLIFEAEKAARDSRSAKELYERTLRLHEEEQKSVQSTLRDLGEQLQTAVTGKQQEAGKHRDALEQCKELRSHSDKLRSQLEESRAQCSQAERTHEMSMSTLKTTLRDLQKDLTDRTRLLQRKSKELEDLKATTHSQLSSAERKYQDESALYQRRAAEAERLARDMEAAGFASDLKSQTAIDEIKEKYGSAMAQLESKMRTEVDATRALSMKIRNSETVIGDLLEEKSNLAQVIEDLQQSLRHQEEELLVAKNTISELSHQLSASHSAREEGAHRAARAIEDVHSAAGSAAGGIGSPARSYYGEHKDGTNATAFDTRKSGDSFGSAFAAQY